MSEGTVESVTIEGKTFTTEERARRRERNRAKRRRQTLRGPDYAKAYARAVKAEKERNKLRDDLNESETARRRLLAKVKQLEAAARKS